MDRPALALNPTLSNVASLGSPDVTFTVGTINFDSTIGSFIIAGFLNNPIFSNPRIVAGRDLYSIIILFTGTVTLRAGNNSFVITHDDGVQLLIDGFGLVVDQPAPTPPVDTQFVVLAPALGEYAFELSYANCCAPPAKLIWDIGPVGVPEPASVALLGAALAIMAVVMTRIARNRRSVMPCKKAV